jgi:hypothetical protein
MINSQASSIRPPIDSDGNLDLTNHKAHFVFSDNNCILMAFILRNISTGEPEWIKFIGRDELIDLRSLL